MKKYRVAGLATGENFGSDRVRGQLFNINPADVTPELRAMLTLSGAPNYPQLNAYLLNSALDRQAIAPLWEVKTARMQESAGDPNAGLTEEERVVKALSSARSVALEMIAAGAKDKVLGSRFFLIHGPAMNDMDWEVVA